MIRIKRFMTECAVDFITILEEDFPRNGNQVVRWRELCTSLDACDRKLAKLLLDT